MEVSACKGQCSKLCHASSSALQDKVLVIHTRYMQNPRFTVLWQAAFIALVCLEALQAQVDSLQRSRGPQALQLCWESCPEDINKNCPLTILHRDNSESSGTWLLWMSSGHTLPQQMGSLSTSAVVLFFGRGPARSLCPCDLRGEVGLLASVWHFTIPASQAERKHKFRIKWLVEDGLPCC